MLSRRLWDSYLACLFEAPILGFEKLRLADFAIADALWHLKPVRLGVVPSKSDYIDAYSIMISLMRETDCRNCFMVYSRFARVVFEFDITPASLLIQLTTLDALS